MKNSNYFLFIFCACLFFSCKKDDIVSGGIAGGVSNKVKVATDDESPFYFTYDNYGRIIKGVYLDEGTDTVEMNYEWLDGELKEIDIAYGDTSFYISQRDATGYVLDDGNGTSWNLNEQHKIESIHYGSQTSSLLWSQGNLITKLTLNSVGDTSVYANYEYFPEIEKRDYGFNFYPFKNDFDYTYGSKNLVKKIIYKYGLGYTEIFDFEYSFDSENRVVAEIRRSSILNAEGVETFFVYYTTTFSY